MKKRRHRILSPNEIQILKFIWKWKVVSTSAVYYRFLPLYKWAAATTYKRLLKLEKRNYISLKFIESPGYFLWSVTRLGLNSIIDELPPLREQGFESEAPRHDLLVLAAHYGNWLPTNTANDVAFFTEQELRRQDQETFLDWMPSVNSHRPDG
jgi:hypothetical protein